MFRTLSLSLAFLGLTVCLYSQRITREEYILKYKNIAVREMERYGIPASINMAQALLESDNGNSHLATEANNHFGIKCKSDWRGETVLYDDDSAGECFKKYSSAEDSYIDHSYFLDNSPRYDALFKLDATDYRGWAYGLKNAGYATNPAYAELLIKIIEDNRLYLLDNEKTAATLTYKDIKTETSKVVIDTLTTKVNVDNYNVTIDRFSGREIRYNNGVEYVIAEKGDTYYSIASDFSINKTTLLKYNELLAPTLLSEGDVVYIKQKAKRSENGHLLYVVEAGETMLSISNKFGIRLNSLYGINNMRMGDSIKEGVQIRLR